MFENQHHLMAEMVFEPLKSNSGISLKLYDYIEDH